MKTAQKKKRATQPKRPSYVGTCPTCGKTIKAPASKIILAGSPAEFPTLKAGHCGATVPMAPQPARNAGKETKAGRPKTRKPAKPKNERGPTLPSEEEIIGKSLDELDILWLRTLAVENLLDRKGADFQDRFLEGCQRLRLINKERAARRAESPK